MPFSLAQYAFADPDRVIAEDLTHSETEKRYFCFGEVNGGILTVRFTYRGGVIRDFLPPPEKLASREEGVKVTIAQSKKSIEFFKAEASKHHTQYQRMIRKLIDTYVDTYAEPLSSRPTQQTARKR